MSTETARRIMWAPKAFMQWNQLGTGVGIDLPDRISGSVGFIPVFPTPEAIREVYPNIDLETQAMKIPVIRVERPIQYLDEQKEAADKGTSASNLAPAAA